MKNKYVFVMILLISILALSMGFTSIYVNSHQTKTKEDMVIVTSFYPMYIATMNIVEDVEGVTLKNLSEPQTGCLHDFQLTPADMKLLSTADVFIINGGGIEAFMEDIAKQYPDLKIIEACTDIELLCEEAHNHDSKQGEIVTEQEDDKHNHDVNPHAWMSVRLYRKQVENIAIGLAECAPEYSEGFLANARNYDGKLEELQLEQGQVFNLTQGKDVVLFHRAYDYIAEDLGLEAVFCMDLDEERQVSAGEVAQVLQTIEHHEVNYIFAEALYGTDMCQMVQKEADVQVLYLNPLNRGEYEPDSYIEGMRENFKLIKEMFK